MLSAIHVRTLLSAALLFSSLSSTAAPASTPVSGPAEALGPHREQAGTPAPAPAPRPPLNSSDSLNRWVVHWNQVAIDASGLDHTPSESRVYGEHLGPGRASRAIAIVQIAVFEALNAVQREYHSYVGMPPAGIGVSERAAVAQAAHDTLAALFRSQAEMFNAQLKDSLRLVPDAQARASGQLVGANAAHRILKMRDGDGSNHAEPRMDVDFFPSQEAGWWRQDPISQVPVALGAHWYKVRPFVMKSATQFRSPPPPAMQTEEYTAAFDEVKRLGGDGVTTPTQRTQDQTHAGIYWAYDGTPSLCAPPRLYNQIIVVIAQKQGSTALQLARLLALANIAMADAGIAIWESKFHYQVWRPVTAIREADEGTGPSGTGDGNPHTIGDPTFSPLGAPASNLTGPNFTPPFPAYPSGHAGFGGALFQTLRRFYGRDDVRFTLVSDEYNGVTRDHAGQVRPLKPRSFDSFSQAEEENARSRIYLGIHWTFDASEGITQGQQVADYVFDSTFRPLRE